MFPAFAPLKPEYDAFLYAVVCREKNGMQLTMASAIARSGADPWNEAARISTLRKDAALKVLSQLVPSEEPGEHQQVYNQVTIDHLFSLLPKPRSFQGIDLEKQIPGSGSPTKVKSATIVSALGILALFAYLCVAVVHFETSKQTHKSDDAPATETGP